MDTIKIAFTDFWPEWKYEDFITPILAKYYNVVIDNNNPDILFHSIFGRNAVNYHCKKILFLGENWRPEQFKSDYSISFDPHNETNFRLPLWQVYLILQPELKERLFNRLTYNEHEFTRWGAFTVSNPSNIIRNSAYFELNTYRHVHSYGKVFTNNNTLQTYTANKYWRDAKDEFFLSNPHKFMLAYENTPYRYYCTEKLMDAFLVGALPIYWGDPRVGEDWNENAFMNVTKYNGNLVELIKDVDTNNDRFKRYYNEPVFNEEQKKKLEDNLINFESWLIEKIKI